MVKSLSDICLRHVCAFMEQFSQLGQLLTREQKETILQRLSEHEQLHPSLLPSVSYHLISNSLKHLNLFWCSQVSDKLLETFAAAKCRLESITIVRCKNVTDRGLTAVCKNQYILEYVKFRELHHMTGKTLASLCSPKLRKADFKHNDNVGSDGIYALTMKCSSIWYLNISRCSKVGDEGVLKAALNLGQNLEVLKASNLILLTDRGMIGLAENCPNLKQLKLYGCTKISQAGILAVFAACKMTMMDLSYCYGVMRGCNSILGRFPISLAKLVLRGVQIKEEDLLLLCSHCTHLECLELCGLSAVTDNVLSEILDLIGENIKELDLSWCRTITDKSVKAIVNQCTSLSKLAMAFCDHIKGEPLRHLTDLQMRDRAKKLKFLSLGACRKFNVDVIRDIIPYCTNLVYLNVAGMVGIDDEILFSLSEYCKYLKFINIKGCTKVTDSGVCELVRCCAFEDMVLSGIHNLTDKTVFALASSVDSSLRYLFLSGCSNISPHTVNYLKFVDLSRNVAKGNLTGERSKYDQIMISFASKAKGLERSCVQLIEI